MMRKEFTVQDGLDIYNKHVEYYCLSIRQNQRGLSREQEDSAFTYFADTCAKTCIEALKTAKTGYDVPRGLSIETIYYRAMGLSSNKILEIQRSMD